MRAQLGQLWRRQASASAEGPFRDELLGAERLDERALTLAARFTIDPRGRARSIRPRLESNARALGDAYRTLATDARTGRLITGSSEWLLDNFHPSPRSSLKSIATCRGPITANCRRSPRVSSGRARIYAMAIELVRHSDGRFERQQLGLFLNTYQRIAPLTIGELWAWPSMLTLALVENLRRLADDNPGHAARAPHCRRPPGARGHATPAALAGGAARRDRGAAALAHAR